MTADGLNATPGVSEIINPPAPTTPEAAATRMAEMDADPAFRDRVKNGDTAAYAEREKLWRVAHGMTPEPRPAVNEIDVLTQMGGRTLAETQARAESLRNDGLSELAIYEYLNGRPVPLAEHQAAQREIARFKTDKAFQQRLRDKDPRAIFEYRRAHINVAMPVVSNSVDGQLQPEIAAWERAHATTKPK
jgi:hypothetical protein